MGRKIGYSPVGHYIDAEQLLLEYQHTPFPDYNSEATLSFRIKCMARESRSMVDVGICTVARCSIIVGNQPEDKSDLLRIT